MPLTVTAEQAERDKNAFLAAQRQAHVPKLAPALQQYSDDHCVWMFNVGPWEHVRTLGSWGIWRIPACLEGEPFARIEKPIPGLFIEPINQGEGVFTAEQIEGAYVAAQILGEGPHLSRSASFKRLGVFIGSVVGPKGSSPLGDEVARANKDLVATYEKLFEEANNAFLRSPKEGLEVTGDWHRLAARKLNRADVSWMKETSGEAMQRCPMCGTTSPQGIILCANCKYIFDEKAYAKFANRIASGAAKT